MPFPSNLQEGRLLRRYKRFLADIITTKDERLTIHCPNPGAMSACADENSRVWYSSSDNKARKYPHTWELVEVDGKFLACINTLRANQLVEHALENDLIEPLVGYPTLRREVKFGNEGSRVDFLLSGLDQDCFVEVKSVTWWQPDGTGIFPDAVTERGRKHLRELSQMVTNGHRAVLIFCAPHTGIDRVALAWQKDPAYAQALTDAVDVGVEVYAYGAHITAATMRINRQLEAVLDTL